MKNRNIFITAISIAFLYSTSPAYWPTDVWTDLVISADPNDNESHLSAQPGAQNETIVLFYTSEHRVCYNIIDMYGEFKLPQYTSIAPAAQYSTAYIICHSLSDGQSGIYAIWNVLQSPVPSENGYYAQRIDSLGNRLWGEEGIHFFPVAEHTFDWCVADDGGFYFVSIPDDPFGIIGELWLQRVDAQGNIAFGDSGIVIFYEPLGPYDAKVAPDGQGGCYVAWEYPPEPNPGIYMNHYNSEAQPLWTSPQMFSPPAPLMDLISDSSGGVIMEIYNNANDWYIHKRIDSTGNVIWTRDDLSMWDSQMVEGDSGYFYLGFSYFGGMIYGQKVRISDGAKMWNQLQWGALMCNIQPYYPMAKGFFFYPPYFYCISSIENNFNETVQLIIQRVDAEGNNNFGEDGYMLSANREYLRFRYNFLIPDEDGVVAVFSHYLGGQGYDLYAKRCYNDGTLGGPNMEIEDLTISISEDDVILSWTAKADSASYFIRKSSTPYTFPVEPDTTVIDTFFIDIEALSNAVLFYNVTWEP